MPKPTPNAARLPRLFAPLVLSTACNGGPSYETLDVDLPDSSGEGAPSRPAGSGGTGVAPTHISVPNRIEAEDFDAAGELSSTDRSSSPCHNPVAGTVTIEEITDASAGCAVGAIEAGEWLSYDVNVSNSGDFDLSFLVAAGESNATLTLSVDDVLRERIEVPGSTMLEEHEVGSVPLSEGEHVLRIGFESDVMYLDAIDVIEAGECTAVCEGKTCGDDWCGGSCGSCDEGYCSSSGTCRDFHEPAATVHGQLRVEGNGIVDENGNTAQLRGVSTQWLNWEKTYSGQIENMRFMRDHWGLGVYRIANGVENDNGFAMEGVRSNRLSFVKELIEMAIELDIYVLVDWHTHEAEYIDLAKDFFTEIASSYGDHPHIIYEPFNEPIGAFGGQSADFWSEELKPYHEQLVATIREHDPDNLIVLGTPLWSQDVEVAAADPVAGDNLAYALHFYSCTHQQPFRDKAQLALDRGAALFVTEWGSTHADGGTSSNPGVCLDAADDWHDFLDERGISSAAWKLANDPDSSSILLPGAAKTGGWTDENLSDHGRYVREILRRAR